MEIAETHPPTANVHKLSVLLEEVKHCLPLFHSQIQPEVGHVTSSQPVRNPEKLDLMLVAEGTFGVQISSSSIGSVQTIRFLMHVPGAVSAVL